MPVSESHEIALKLFKIALATGLNKEQAKLVAATGSNMQGVTKIYINEESEYLGVILG